MTKSVFDNPALHFLNNFRPPSDWSLRDLIEAFAQHLLTEADTYEFPVDFSKIIERYELTIQGVQLPQQRGLVTPGLQIIYNSSDKPSVQLYSIAHELMELLFLALVECDPEWLEDAQLEDLFKQKEQLCEQGAAELLMPMKLFRPTLQQLGVSMQTAMTIAQDSKLSLIAVLRRIVDSGLRLCILVIWDYRHSPNEHVPSAIGQLNFLGNLTSMDPPEKLRVDRVFKPPTRSVGFIKQHKSVEMDTAIARAFQSPPGTITKGYDYLEIGPEPGVYRTESVPAAYDGHERVISLIFLDDERAVS